jgi:hypothetical protein
MVVCGGREASKVASGGMQSLIKQPSSTHKQCQGTTKVPTIGRKHANITLSWYFLAQRNDNPAARKLLDGVPSLIMTYYQSNMVQCSVEPFEETPVNNYNCQNLCQLQCAQS